MELNDILFVVITIVILVNGYSLRKGYVPGILISVIVAETQLFVRIGDTGTYEYIQTVANVSSWSWVVGIAYVFFVWGIGYILGGITIKKKDNNDNLPGRDIESEIYRLN